MKKCKAEDMTIVEASRFLKIHIDELYEHIESGTVICKDGYIKKEFLNKKFARKKYKYRRLS